jgi:DNA-binding response OmpR family regulator
VSCKTYRGMVLLVEDNANISTLAGEWLERCGYEVDYANNGVDACNLASENTYDAVVLDISLPRLNGLEVCRRIRCSHANSEVPVLLLSAHIELDDKLEGLAAGADDYMTKPFFPAELDARIASLIRRRRAEVAPKMMEVHGLRIDPRLQQVTRDGKTLDILPTGFRILSILMREHPHVVTRQALERELWGSESPESDSLRSHIYGLRKLIDRGQAVRLLQTIPTVGYRLHPVPVGEEEALETAPRAIATG